MCGVPHQAVEHHVAKLVAAGRKVAICDQVEDPRAAKGLVRRDITRVVTPGTVLDPESLVPNAPSLSGRAAARADPRLGRRVPGPLDGPLLRRARCRARRVPDVAGALPPAGDPPARTARRPRVSGGRLAPAAGLVERPPELAPVGRSRPLPRRRGAARAYAAEMRPGGIAHVGDAGAAVLRPADGARRGGHRHPRALRILGRLERAQPLRPPGPDAHAARRAGAAGGPLRTRRSTRSTSSRAGTRWRSSCAAPRSPKRCRRRSTASAISSGASRAWPWAPPARARSPRSARDCEGASRGRRGGRAARRRALSLAAREPFPTPPTASRAIEATLAPEPPVLASAGGAIRDGRRRRARRAPGAAARRPGRDPRRSRPRSGGARASPPSRCASTGSSATRSRSPTRTATAFPRTGSAGSRWRTPSASSRRR